MESTNCTVFVKKSFYYSLKNKTLSSKIDLMNIWTNNQFNHMVEIFRNVFQLDILVQHILINTRSHFNLRAIYKFVDIATSHANYTRAGYTICLNDKGVTWYSHKPYKERELPFLVEKRGGIGMLLLWVKLTKHLYAMKYIFIV